MDAVYGKNLTTVQERFPSQKTFAVAILSNILSHELKLIKLARKISRDFLTFLSISIPALVFDYNFRKDEG